MIDYDEIAKRPSLMEVGMKMTVCDVLDFLISPFYGLVKGTYQGYRQAGQDAEKEVSDFLVQLDARAEKADQKYRAERVDDLNYEMGLLSYKKSAIELGRMLNPSLVKVSGTKRQKSSRQPKVSMNYKEYCCD